MISLRAIFSSKLAVVAGVASGLAVAGTVSHQLAARQKATVETITRSQRLVRPAEPTQSDRLSITTKPPANRPNSADSNRGSNPLWAIPLASLTATRERPMFSPTRRPPVAVRPASSAPTLPVVNQPRRLLLVLVGAIAGQSEGLAIFFDDTTKGIIRLKTGESHSGWTLRSVATRKATLQNGREIAVLALPSALAE